MLSRGAEQPKQKAERQRDAAVGGNLLPGGRLKVDQDQLPGNDNHRNKDDRSRLDDDAAMLDGCVYRMRELQEDKHRQDRAERVLEQLFLDELRAQPKIGDE